MKLLLFHHQLSKMKISTNKELDQYLHTEFSKLRSAGVVETNTSKFFGQIGSTLTEDIPYKNQLEVKLNSCRNLFSELIDEQILNKLEITPSPETFEYRFKTEFVCSFNPKFEPNTRFGQRKKGSFNWVVDLDEFNLVPQVWFNKTREIFELLTNKGLKSYDLKTHQGELRYLVLKVYNNTAMLNIVTRTGNNQNIIDEAAKKALELGFKSVYWVKQESIGDRSFGDTIKFYGDEYIQIDFQKPFSKSFLVGPNSFFQNNIHAFQQILELLFENFKDLKISNLIDLYCGVGTIGMALSDICDSILGIDNNEENIMLAGINASLNKLQNKASYQLGDSSTLKIDNFVVENSLLIVDPPRTGLDKETIELIQNLKPANLVYISCNPVTQKKDLEELLKVYKLESLKIFDLFPHTYHMESVAILKYQ